MRIEIDRESDGRWIAEAIDFPGVMAYGTSEAEAKRHVYVLTESVMRDEAKGLSVDEHSKAEGFTN